MDNSVLDTYRKTTDKPGRLAGARMLQGLEQRLNRQEKRRKALAYFSVGVATTVFLGVTFLALKEQSLPQQVQPGKEIMDFTTDSVTREVALPLDSRLLVEAGSRVRVNSLGNSGAVIELLKGTIEVDVNSGPGTRWFVEVNDYTIEAVGTRFRVGRIPGAPEITMYEGVVLLTGPDLASDGVRIATPEATVKEDIHLSANHEDSVLNENEIPEDEDELLDEVQVAEIAEEPKTAEKKIRSRETARKTAPLPLPTWITLFREAIHRGDTESAIATLPVDFPDLCRECTSKDLLDGGDVLFTSGYHKRSERSYRACCRHDRESVACAVAQARLALARAGVGDRNAAIDWATQYLDKNSNGAFAREMLGNRMRWLHAEGRLEEAKRDAGRLLERWPESAVFSTAAKDILQE